MLSDPEMLIRLCSAAALGSLIGSSASACYGPPEFAPTCWFAWGRA
jgi:hypothetical protein